MKKHLLFTTLLIMAIILSTASFYHGHVEADVIPVITEMETAEKLVALTFDDGPDPRYTPQVLDILKEYDVKATFFMVGQNIEENLELALRVKDEGHQIANHTYTHRSLTKIPLSEVKTELEKCQEVLHSYLEVETSLVRPPRRHYNEEILQVIDDMNLQVALWSINLESKHAPTPEKMVKRVVKNLKPGTIILAHDGDVDRTLTVQALPDLIEKIKSKGYKFVTLDEFFLNKEETRI